MGNSGRRGIHHSPLWVRPVTIPPIVDEPRRPASAYDGPDIRQLRVFLAVAEERSFTRAAERLHLAQQGVSASVRRLETQVGVALFVRDTRSVALTPAGEALVDGARAVIAAADEAVARVRLVAEGRSGRLVVGFSTAAGGVGAVRDALRRFAADAPDVDLRTVEHDFGDPSAGLADGPVQAAFIFGPHPLEGLASVPLVEEGRLLAVHPDHPLARRRAVGAEDLADLPWLRVPAPDGPWPEWWFPRRPGTREGPVIRTADEWVTAVEAGRGAAFTMPCVMRNFAETRVATVPVLGMAPATVLLAWREGEADALVEALVASVRRRIADDRPAPG